METGADIGLGVDSGLLTVPFEDFLDAVRTASASDGHDGIDAVLQRLRPELGSLSDWVRLRPGRYTRTLAYRDESVEILVLSWSRGSQAPVHDHGAQRCWMLLMHGGLEVTGYRLISESPLAVEPTGPTRRLAPGELDAVPPDNELHSVAVAEGAPMAITVHVYSRPIDRCRVFDPVRRTVQERRLRYDYVGPRTRRELAPEGLNLARQAPEADNVLGRLRNLWRRTGETTRDWLVPSEVPRRDAHVRAENVGHHFGELEALRDVTLNVRSGEFLCLLGPSGCGKTTLLHALAGHVKPTGGELSMDGKPITGPGPDRLLMFQDAALIPWLTVEQNITFMLAARGVPRGERAERARHYVRQVQLSGFESALPHQLSGGMKMRASLARALAMEPPALLMDEPFGSLDAQTRLRMHELLHRLWREQGTTIVFVTHDVHEAVMLATRVVLMAPRPGRVVADLELHAPSERDPDDGRMAELAGKLRRILHQAEGLRP